MSHKNNVAPWEDVDDKPSNGWKKNPNREKTETEITMRKPKKLSAKQKFIRAARFDAFYKQLGSKCKDEHKRIDLVLAYPKEDKTFLEKADEDEIEDYEKRNSLREKFEEAMKEDGLQKQSVVIGDNVYIRIHCPFRRLCQEAERVSLEMPLNGCESDNKEDNTPINRWIKKKFRTDNEVDYISAPFKMDNIHIFEDYDDPSNFFRPAMRSLLVDHMLINIDLRHLGETGFKKGKNKGSVEDPEGQSQSKQDAKTAGNCWGCIDENVELGELQKVGLDYMMMEKVYTEKFVLHEESAYHPDMSKEDKKKLPKDDETLKHDPRLDLTLTWPKSFFKFQPLWKIRNYFGEKIGMYFAWTGVLISTLWLPTLFGFAVFLYGLVESIRNTADSASTGQSNSTLTDLFVNIKGSFDNDVTPFFAMFLCIWGTIFLEVWKRKQSELAYQWDVDQFEENEPDRPEFYGTKERIDPVTNEVDWYYPFKKRAWKICLSTGTLLFMVCIVIISVVGVIVYRVIATVDYCPGLPASECLFISTLLSSIMNAVSILILGRIYDYVARKLTDWENHRTDTKYNDALIIKLFAFQFVNNYSSCFYIAFVRGRLDTGMFGNDKYTDNCEGTCMSQLSFQILVLMITKPLPKFATDVIMPWALKLWRKHCQCCACIPFLRKLLKINTKPDSEKSLLEIECEKPTLGNFTLGEYTEKCILYGLMMLFAASFPLAPLLAILFLMIDIRVDAWRMLWVNQRPQAIIAEDIGTWFVILNFLNFCGVVSNAFLIAFTSTWGSKYSTADKLWIVIGFEHIVFSVKFLVAYMIPDVPGSVALARRKKRFQIQKKMAEEALKDKEMPQSKNFTHGKNSLEAHEK
ncbi:anoctamin-4-like isoform X2 [Mya arenaria]|uniref:anoctamin-4-like isoform X2 n=1 Tax=Mya arenaria TaxID=6604 RepID=UPI0022E80F7C|nr:anoctamin-4-like isoform X2 [Mya arenaria]